MLFKSNTDVMKCAPFSGTPNFVSISPTIQMVEEKYLIDIIGTELYNKLNTAYKNATAETDLQPALLLLLTRCRLMCGSYIAHHYISISDINLTDAGARRLETEKDKTAFQYQVTNFKKETLQTAEMYAEKLLEFLEENKADYPEWVTSKQFIIYRKLFIKSAKEFNEIYRTIAPYRNYWAMRFKMIDVEEITINEAITEPLFADLKTKALTAAYTFTEAENELLFMLKKAIVYYTVAQAVPALSIRIDDFGLTVTKGETNTNDSNKLIDANETKISHLIRSAESSAKSWLNKAVKYINNNATEFAAYTVPKVEPISEIGDNANLETAYGLI